MRKLTLALRTCGIALVVTLPVLADAPLEGMDRQYDTFTSSDRIIHDLFTDLVWRRTPITDVDYDTASGLCPEDTRLPTLKELLTIVDEAPHQEYVQAVGKNETRFTDPNAFSKTPRGDFWTSSSAGPDHVFTVNFGTGQVNSTDTSAKISARCVAYVP